jgi:hypothetical protein
MLGYLNDDAKTSEVFRHATVAKAGVVGLCDPRWIAAPAAGVIVRSSARVMSEKLGEFCRHHGSKVRCTV